MSGSSAIFKGSFAMIATDIAIQQRKIIEKSYNLTLLYRKFSVAQLLYNLSLQ